MPDIVQVLGPRPFDMKDSLKEYLTELRERAEMDDKLTQEEREAELQKLKALRDSTKFDPNAREDDDDESKAAEPDRAASTDAKAEKGSAEGEAEKKNEDNENKK